jgi:hypothetical protein
MITATLHLDDGTRKAYELGERKTPPTYIIHQGDLYAVQPWKLPAVWSDDIAAGYCRIQSLDVSQWLPVAKREAA